MRFRTLCFSLSFSLLALAVFGSSARAEERHPDFLMTPELRKQVEFWKRIYSEYDTKQSLIHDARYIDVIYDIVTAIPGETRLATSRRIRAEKLRWRKVLLSLHSKNRSLSSGELTAETSRSDITEDERRVLKLMANITEPNKFLNAAHRRRLRVQLGQKDRFQEGYIASGRYLSRMEEIFRAEGLPIELTRLPFVESSFNLKARSKVGASGIWQFMRSTGRLYLKIRADHDERNDPIRATEAAAKLLKTNYEALGNWPLAVTAYNHGRMGLMRAVRQVNSSRLEDLIANYRSRTFGFASQNFFTCLVAAIEVEREAERHFGAVTRDPALRFFEVELPHSIKARDLRWYFQWENDRFSQIRDLNPALSASFWSGYRPLPLGYRLRLPLDGEASPEEQTRVFLLGYEEMRKALSSGKGRRAALTTKQ